MFLLSRSHTPNLYLLSLSETPEHNLNFRGGMLQSVSFRDVEKTDSKK